MGVKEPAPDRKTTDQDVRKVPPAPLLVARKRFQEELVSLINSTNVPAFVIVEVLTEARSVFEQLAEQQYKKELEAYQQELTAYQQGQELAAMKEA